MKPAPVRLAQLTGDDRPIAAFAFDWRSPSYGDRLISNDFTAVVLHESGPSLAWHGQLVQVRAGDAHVVPAGSAHRVYDFGKAAGIAIAFLPSVLEHARELAGALRLVPTPIHVPDAAFASLRRLAQRMIDETRTPALGSREVLHGLALCVVADLCRAAGATEAPRSGPVDAALAFIERSYARPISLRDVAKAVAISPRHLATRVRRETGRSVGEWLTTFRIARARMLLRTSDLSVDEIAVEVGWSDVTHFIRMFTRHERRTPSAFRRAVRQAAP